MSDQDQMCGTARELLPDFVRGSLSGRDRERVEEHLGACSECGEELELVSAIYASRRSAPDELMERLLGSITTARPGQPNRAWWSVAAAAVAALALGIGIASDPGAGVIDEVPGYAYEVDEGEIWVSDDGLLAGAPLFDDLSDDDLLQLLDELSVGAAGGSA